MAKKQETEFTVGYPTAFTSIKTAQRKMIDDSLREASKNEDLHTHMPTLKEIARHEGQHRGGENSKRRAWPTEKLVQLAVEYVGKYKSSLNPRYFSSPFQAYLVRYYSGLYKDRHGEDIPAPCVKTVRTKLSGWLKNDLPDLNGK